MKGFCFLSFFCTAVSTFSAYLTAANTISSNSFITDGQTLVSPAETFELGFFGSEKRYLGISYKNISNHTVVWVANNENPLTDSSGVLRIDDHGNLVLLNRIGSIIWSTNITGVALDPVAELLESGNLVLRNNNSVTPDGNLWQSFDYPSNTLLPGMKLGWTLKDGLNRSLKSWKSETDPSHGDYSVGIDDPHLPQVIVWNKSHKATRLGPWNGVRFSGGPGMEGSSFIPYFVYENDEVSYKEEPAYNSSITRFILNPSGLFQRFAWNYQLQGWSLEYALQEDQCGSYNMCGPNGFCKHNSAPICECLGGFTPKSPEDWRLHNYSGGCIPKTQLRCGNEDEFQQVTRMQLPDTLHYWLNKNTSLVECKVECSKNCSCMAYANSNITGDGSGCILWFGNLIDIQQFDYGGQNLYIRTPSGLEVNKRERGHAAEEMKIILPVVLAVLILGLIVSYVVLKRRNRKGNVFVNNQDVPSTNESRREDFELPLYDFATIAMATNNLFISNKIGEGGFGPVYKGILTTGQEIAVKRLSKNSRQGLEEFMNEVILIVKLQHRNLVRLLGCCIQGEERMLIYEYMSNKSLDSFIFGNSSQEFTRSHELNWEKRFIIIVGIARGLLYLHRDSRLRIIHRDLKASNILLDTEMIPKISDFGMARTFGGHQTEENTNRVVGTYGYMSPEYATDGLFSVKSDVFSFGVLVLEIVSGKRNRGFHHSEHDFNLLGHAWKLLNEDKALELMDASIRDSFTVSEVLRCIKVSLLCVQKFPEDRPTMSSVLSMLDTEGIMLPWPKEPGFYTERSTIDKDSSSARDTAFTGSETTITLLEGR